MRRSHAGNYYEPLGQHSNEVEDENDKLTEELKDKIHVLKSLSIDIGNEVKFQDKLLREVDDDMDRTGGFLVKYCFFNAMPIFECGWSLRTYKHFLELGYSSHIELGILWVSTELK
ncbi:hypothetical protein FQA39_LY01168 [Lamprigera yunnana]|nr:hypothetical protein FQA39_LY01168 [Lamprigera yunnana]